MQLGFAKNINISILRNKSCHEDAMLFYFLQDCHCLVTDESLSCK